MKAIEAMKLSKRYANGVVGLHELDLTVERGEIFGFLGPNGAGKTTTVRLLNGTLTPSGGEARVLGANPGDDAVRARTSTLAELANMYDALSVIENLRFFAGMYGMERIDAERRIEELLREVKLWDKRALKLGSFSTGMKKRVQLVRALLHRPELVFLDEPTSGLDPDHALRVTRLIRRLAKESGMTVLLCTHNLPLAEEICDSFGFIAGGALVRHGSKAELMEQAGGAKEVIVRAASGELRYRIGHESEINGVIRGLLDRGEEIHEVLRPKPSLLDLYFQSVGNEAEPEEADELV
jgi:ABC-2 type transport system ATP-binding protein